MNIKDIHTLRRTSVICGLAAFSVSNGLAVVIARYDMETLTLDGTQSTSLDVGANADLMAGGFTENLTGGTNQNEFGRQSLSLIPAGVNGLSARSMNAGASNPWWEFTITPNAGTTVELTTMTLDAGISLTLSNSNWDYDVSWSIDGFGTTLGTFDGPSGTMTTITSTDLSIDLSSLPAQSDSFTVRVSPNRIGGTNGAASQRAGWIDNVTLNGDVTTAIPEPSSLALLGLSGLALLRRRR